MTTILFHEGDTQLRQEDDGSLVLNVLCGGIGMYEVEIVLTEADQEKYNWQGDDFIQKLAAQIKHNPAAYGNREIGS